jgi:ferredoxin-NADP reductase/ferredoxin
MPTVACGNARIELGEGETVLEGLLRAGVEVPNGCRAGACRACLVRATAGTPPPAAQVGLRPKHKAEGYFLACSAKPAGDLTVSLEAAAALEVPSRVVAIELLSRDVARVMLVPETPFPHRAGQFVTLTREDGLARSYSIASLPEAGDALELHVRRLPQGRMSPWLCDPSNVGARVRLRGPEGECVYEPGAPEQPIVLAGTGTGLAPLVGILQDALRAEHRGRITLLHGARDAGGLYLVEELRSLAQRHGHVTYLRCVLEGEAPAGAVAGALDRVLLERFPSLAGHRVFLCGDAALVQALKRKVFLAGAALGDIRADPFILSPAPAPAAP